MLISYKKPRGRFFIVGKPGGQPVAEWTVTVTAGANGTVSVNGVTGDYSATVPDGTVLTLEATASEHYAFTQWSDGVNDNPRTITVTSDIALSSENDPLSYSVSVYSNGNGSVSVDGTPGDYSETVADGTVLTLEATADTDYEFDSWSDGDSTNPRTLTVDDDVSLGASFQEVVPPVVEWSVSVYSNGNGSVSVDGTPGDYSETVADGTVLTLEATADTDYEFDSWSDGDSTNPRTLTVDSDVSLSATFQEVVPPVVEWSVSVYSNGNGSVSVDGVTGDYSATVPDGTVLALEATADTDYEFDSWSDGDSTNPRTLTVDSDVSLSATFQEAEPPSEYFYIQDLSGNNNTLTLTAGASAPVVNVSTSTDQSTWTTPTQITTGGLTFTVPANGKLYLKAVADKWSSGSSSASNTISCSGSYAAGGCIASLLFGDNYQSAVLDNTINSSALAYLFYTSPIKYAHGLIMPDTVTTSCYANMFSSCYILETAPELPATTLAMANYCYQRMFYGCRNLTTLPELPATTLANGCYNCMFQNCTSLTTAPELPATTLVSTCYARMFQGCSSLNDVTIYANDVSVAMCLNSWLSGVANTGTFHNLGSASYPSGSSGIPTGWTEVTS